MFVKFKVNRDHSKVFSSALTALERTLDLSLVMHFTKDYPLAINAKRNDLLFSSLYFKDEIFEVFDNEEMKVASIQNSAHLTKPFRHFKSAEVFIDESRIVITDEDKTEFSFPLLISDMGKIKRMDFNKIEAKHLVFDYKLPLEDIKELIQVSDFVSDSDEFEIISEAGSDILKLKIGSPISGVFKKDMKIANPSNTGVQELCCLHEPERPRISYGQDYRGFVRVVQHHP